MFNIEQARKDGNLAKALIRMPDGGFRWCRVRILSPFNQFGQIQVERVVNGWYGTTDKIRNLSENDKQTLAQVGVLHDE